MSPKTPRGVSGKALIKGLALLGYQPVRQRGSHARLRTEQSGEHFVTIPIHDSIPVGTLNSILREVADHFQISKEELLQRLFPV
ncbi:MAG: type II toxin-antitoxin system HicA family toxin [Bacteroidetes bacterium]|nr:type II toxin-antitoxin system HicA family toxin [Bacteroidota bacterium]